MKKNIFMCYSKVYDYAISTYLKKFYVYLNYLFIGHFICLFLISVHFEKLQFIIPYFSDLKVHLKY